MRNEQLQNALDAITASAGESNALIAAKCRGLLRGYHARWAQEQIEVETVEQTYIAPLTNPDTGHKSRTFEVAGKIDVVAKIDGETWIIDHKTTSENIDDPASPYWRQLAIEGQVTHYMLLMWLHGIRPAGAMWDVIKKPSIAPKRLTKAERAAVVANRSYFGFAVSQQSLDHLQIEEAETHELYEYRLANDCTHERPERYFQRRQVPRLDGEILEYSRELWQHSQDMIYTAREMKDGRLPVRNSGACLLYGRPCGFLGICSGHDTIDSMKWQRKEHTHPELGGVESPLEILTNSRIRCFQTCRRKEHYQYRVGIERADDDNESLYFGSLFHVGMDAWFSFLKGDEHDSDSNGHSVSGIESPSLCAASG